MEPLDPAKNDEGSGFSKRRISSILKAPRKSMRSEQQENVVECAKPVEKRNSRRVSFAPANDVLLFSKDVKNASPARSPFQELVTTAAATQNTQNRVQVAVPGDGIQHIMGMETLLNAPLHASQQKDKVGFDTGDDFGERTVMFSTDDAFMDMTQSHTINIAGDAELLTDISLQNYDVLPTSREKTVMFAADEGSMDMTLSHTLNMTSGSVSLPTSRNMDLSADKRNTSSSAHSVDPGFKNFLSNLFKPSGTSINPEFIKITPPAGASPEETHSFLAPIKTKRPDVDKENKAPASVSAVMEKSLNTSKKICESSYGNTLYPNDDVSMDMTEAQTGLIQGVTDDEDPLQCLFPTQEMYESIVHPDKKVPRMSEEIKQQQRSKTLASYNPKDMTSLKNPSLRVSHQGHKTSHDTKDECSEKTIMFTAGDEFMDMTQSHTANIASGSLDLPNQNHACGKIASSLEEGKHETRGLLSSSANCLDPGFSNFCASLRKTSAPGTTPVILGVIPPTAASSMGPAETNSSLYQQKTDANKENQSLNTARGLEKSFNRGTICPENDVSMDMTETQTGRIIGLTSSDDPFQILLPTHDTYSHHENPKRAEIREASGQNDKKAVGSSKSTAMGTSLKPSLKTTVQRHQVKFDAEDDCREKTVRFSADDACMEVTQSHTVHIATDLVPQDMYPQHSYVRKAEVTLGQQPCEALGSSNYKGVETSLTGSLRMNVQKHQAKFDTEDAWREKTVRFTAEDACMDVTRSHTANIVSDLKLHSHQNLDSLPTCGEKTMRFNANDAMASMDVTQSHTANIVSDLQLHSYQNLDSLPTCGEKTMRFNANDAAMDVTRSLTVNIATDLDPLQSHQRLDFLPACGEKTVRFNANDAAMDVTRSLTVNIATDLDPLQSHQRLDFLPACGEKTVRFNANDAAMDVTGSHTVNIATNVDTHNMELLPTSGEKTVRFTANDAAMDVTQSHTVNIVSDFDPQSHKNMDSLPTCTEKTVRFTANDAAMDVTGSHTVNIATNVDLQSHKKVDFLPTSGEKTVRFTANDAAMDVTGSHTVNIATNVDIHNTELLPIRSEKTERFTANHAAMDVTQSHTVNIVSNSVSDSVLSQQDSNILSARENMGFPLSVRKRENNACLRRSRSSSAHTLEPGLKNSLFKMSDPWANPMISKAVTPTASFSQETVDKNGLLDQLEMQTSSVNTEKEVPGLVPTVREIPASKIMTDFSEDGVSRDLTEAQTGHILGQTSDEPPQCRSSTQEMYSIPDHLNRTEETSQQTNAALGFSNPDSVEVKNHPDSLDSNETENRTKPVPINQACSPSAVDHDRNAVSLQKSRRMSLADLHSKVRRLSHMINTAPEITATDSCTASLPQLELDMDKNLKDKTKSLPGIEHELETGLVDNDENTQAQFLSEEEQPSTTATTPFNLKTQQLMSRLSVGGFKPKLPRRSKQDDPKRVSLVEEHTRTIAANVTNQLNNFDEDVSDIYDEELGSIEDTTEILDTGSPLKVTERVDPSQEFYMDGPLMDDVFEQDFVRGGHGKKRSLPGDESNEEDEKRMKASAEMATDFEMGLQSNLVESDFATAPCTATQATDDYNSSRTASIRCEAAFESTLKQSLFESQLEDYANDMQRKFDDGTITVLEFFKLFNIDFVIHNPRQSVLPGRLVSDTDRTPMDLLKDKHINYPKQMVYETNVLNLTEKVEGLKERMQDLEKPLRIVNRPLWEEISNASETELRSFGAKLKERNNLFRKMSKVQSHEMKEVLYSNLVQANLEEQQSLRGSIEKADEMIRSLDACILELETEIAAVEEKGFKDTPSLKSRQEEMQKVTEAVTDNERQMSELEMQKKQDLNKLNRLKAETRKLEIHVTALHTVNEWKFGEKTENYTVYTFLHDSLHLQVAYEKLIGNNADNQLVKKISHITFEHHLNDEESQDHACLVHKLLSQYIEGKTAWVEKYPTSRHVPKLLHDVGLVVSRCRLLGEELHRLKMWGSLKLDILSINCVDTQVHIVFSSLKKFSKFEVTFSVSLTDHLCVLQVQSFKNMIGSTKIQQIEEIVTSFSPGKNLLTKIVKEIHRNILC